MSSLRFLPDTPLPPYTYVPGRTPHPVSDPRGHMYHQKEEPAILLVNDWSRCRAYLRGVDLFNHGYYWEAHEVWESLWHAAGRSGAVADFLKGLIKLAAAGVKSLEGSSNGCRRHALRAGELFRKAAETGHTRELMGLSLEELERRARVIALEDAESGAHEESTRAKFSSPLFPGDTDSIAAPDRE